MGYPCPYGAAHANDTRNSANHPQAKAVIGILIPDAAHLPALAAILCVAILCIGLGSLVGARRAETALIAGWGLGGAISVVVGTLTALPLWPVMLAAGLAGCAGIAREIARAAHGRPRLICGTAFRVAVLALPFLVLIESIQPSGWDDFSHWLPNLRYLAAHQHYPTLLEPNTDSVHAGYPYGLALPCYAASLLIGSISDSSGIYWNAILLIAACAGIADFAERRAAGSAADPAAWTSAGLGLLLGVLLSFKSSVVLSNMTDGSTSAVHAILCVLVIDQVAVRRTSVAWRDLATLACCSVAFVGLRQTNVVLLALTLAGFGAALLLWRRRLPVTALLTVAAPLLAGAVVWWLWNRYALREIPQGQFSLLRFADWRWATLPLIVLAIIETIAVKFGLYVLLLWLGVKAVLLWLRRPADPEADFVILAAVVLASVGNMLFLVFAYLAANFTQAEAEGAASFARYAQHTGLAIVLALVASLPGRWLSRAIAGRAGIALCAAAMIVPWLSPTAYRADLRSPVLHLSLMAEDILQASGGERSILLVDPSGNGYDVVALAYAIKTRAAKAGRPAPPVAILWAPEGLSADELTAGQFAESELVWLAEGNAAASVLASVTLNPRCSYLLSNAGGRFDMVRSWLKPQPPTSASWRKPFPMAPGPCP